MQMIYTVTFNPALDYAVWIEDLKPGETNRAEKEQLLAGGKGINVSIVLKNLGLESTALGFVAGFTGREIAARLEEQGIYSSFIQLPQGFSRINVKMKGRTETEVNGIGPDISEEYLELLLEQLKMLTEEDILVLAGSIPKSLPDTIYKDIMEMLLDKRVSVVVDATKNLLVNVLQYRPFLIKPNNHELGELFEVELKTRDEVVPYAKKLQEQGARNVLVSMAGEGAVLLTENGEVYESPAPRGAVKNSVGAGDSMVAGFVAGYTEKKDYQWAFRMGIATGSASAFSENLATRHEVERILAGMQG